MLRIRTRVLKTITAIFATSFLSAASVAEPPSEIEAQILQTQKVYKAEGQQKITPVMLLGVFHFEGSAADTYSQGDASMLSPARQEEISVVLDALEKFAPTKIGVEEAFSIESDINADYSSYLVDEFTLTGNEIHQLGFRLAKRLGHKNLYAIDADGRSLDKEADLDTVATEQDQVWLDNDPVEAGWIAAKDLDFEWVLNQPLKNTLIRMNDPRVHKISHSIYLLRYLSVTDGINYPSADAFISKWYNRNIRIFGNILRVAEGSAAKDEERVLIIIGNGHVPILKHLVENSGSLELISVDSILAE